MTDIRPEQSDESAEIPGGESAGFQDMTVVSSTPLMSETGPRNSSFSELAKLLKGQQLNHFQLLETIGGGGMGVVFRAVDTRLGRTVAVKVLSRYEAGDEDALIRFKNEAQSAARLDHVNIARVYFVGEDKGWHYIVFEYIDGINVRDLVERSGPLSLEDAISYTLQIAEALGHASRRDVVHRDIKPSNVLITEERRAKLVDMGLARMHQVEHSSDDLTASGVTLGTFDYISPEQARDPRNADVRSDIYSLGCTLFFVLAGRPPFPEGTVLQKLLKHQSEPPPSLRNLRPDAPAELLAIADKMLAKKPEDRFQDAASLVSELHTLAEKLGVRTGSTSGLAILNRPASLPSVWTKHLPWALPVATLVFAVVLLEVLWSARADSTPPPPVSGTLQISRTPDPERSSQAGAPQPSVANPDDRLKRPEDLGPEKIEDDIPRPIDPPKNDRPGETPADGSVGPKDSSRTIEQPLKTPASDKTEPDVSNPMPRDATPEKNDNTPRAIPTTGRLLVVGGDYTGERQYATLRAACQAAKSGDVIELRYDGARTERPIRFKQDPLTIRAGRKADQKRYRPQIVFRPNESELSEFDSGMLVVESGANLRLIGVHLILDPGEVAAQQWSLISLLGANSVKATDCWLTIRNAADNDQAYHRDVAFFHARPNAKQGVMKLVDPSMVQKAVSIELSNCVVRGEARVLQIDELELVNFQWNNGLCATTEPLLFARGGKVDAPSSSAMTHIDLRHLTAILPGGLFMADGRKTAPYHRPISIRCADSIFVGNANTPFFRQNGIDSRQQLQENLHYFGERIFYQGIQEFWRIDSRQAEESQVSALKFGQWLEHWRKPESGGDEVYPQLDKVLWQGRPDFTGTTHNRVPAEFQLEAHDNPAIGGGEGGASDGRDAGMLSAEIRDFTTDESAPAEEETTPAIPEVSTN